MTMSSDKVKNIEDKVRELGEQGNIRGAEEQLEAYNKIQNQLININSEKAANLQEEKVYSALENQNNQNIAQLSELINSPQQTVVPQQVTQLSPGTLDILGKYGYGQPIKQSNRTQNTQVTPDKIIINNNTENITTNNVQVPQPQPIINTQPVVQKNDNTDKFKVWLNNEFARQREQASIREREFEKREWSLNRSNSKLMTYLEDLGKGFAENLNPQKIGNIFGDQLKTLYFLLGFQYIANNWKRILNGVASIESWIKEQAAYFGIGEAGKRLSSEGGGFVNDLKVFLGGEKDQSLKDVFFGLFESAGEMLMERIKLFFQDRADAIKSIKFPDIISTYKSEGLMAALKEIGLYLGDILSCMMGGKAGLSNAIKAGMERTSESSHVGKNSAVHKGVSTIMSDSGIEDTSLGDASVSVGAGKQDWMEKGDLVDGKLSNNMISSIRQANSVESYLKEKESTSTVHTGAIMSGLENLKVSANENKKTLVGEDFFKTLSQELGIDLSEVEKNVPKGKYKYVKEKKTDKDFRDEGIVDPAWAGIEGYLDSELNKSINESLGWLGEAKSWFDKVYDSPLLEALSRGRKAINKKKHSKKNKLTLVPESDSRPAEEIEVKKDISHTDYRTGKTYYSGKEKKKIFEFYELTPEIINAIEKKLAEKLKYEEFKIGFKDTNSLEKLNDLLKENKKRALEVKLKNTNKLWSNGTYKNLKSKLESLKSDINIEDYDKTLDDLEERRKERHEEYKETFDDSQFGKFTENVKEGVTNAFKKAKSIFNEKTGRPYVVFGEKRDFIKMMLPIYDKILEKKGISTEFSKYLVAQDGNESTWGQSQSGDFNFGGITVPPKLQGKGLGRRLLSNEDEYDKNGNNIGRVYHEFRNFKSVEDYANYHVNLLNNSNYRAFDGGTDEFFKRVHEGGYCPAKDYPERLQSSLNTLNLTLEDIEKEKEKEESNVKYVPKNPMSLPENNVYLTRGEDLEKYPGFENIDNTTNYVTENINIPEIKPRIGESSFGIGLNEDGSENTSYTPIVSNTPLKPVNLDTNISKYIVPALDENNFTNIKLTEMAENIKLQTEALIVYGENLQTLAATIASNSRGQNITINNSPTQRPQAPSYTSTPGSRNNNIGD